MSGVSFFSSGFRDYPFVAVVLNPLDIGGIREHRFIPVTGCLNEDPGERADDSVGKSGSN
ncbi:hypothetical protein JCM10914A_43260 [Paenibacillus sp. JCM 10914]